MLMITRMLEIARGDRAAPDVRRESGSRFADWAVPAVVVWNVCRQCNMWCPHCYLAAGPKAGSDELSTDEGLALLDRLAAAGIANVIVSGGEPLMRPDVTRLIAHATGLGMVAHLSTNGVLLTEPVVAGLVEAGLTYVGVSIDGPEQLNDDYRGLAGGYAQALAGLDRCRAAGLRTGLRMTLTRRNARHLEEVHRIAAEHRIARFYLSHLVYSGRGKAMMAEALGQAEGRAVVDRAIALAEDGLDRGLPTAVVTGAGDSDGVRLVLYIRERYGAEAAAVVEDLLRARGGNSAGEGVLCIDPKGRVFPDPFWRTVSFGDLRTQGVAEILDHPLRSSLREREARLTGRCGECRWKDLCRGGHRARAEAATGDIWGSDPDCVLTDLETSTRPTAIEQEIS